MEENRECSIALRHIMSIWTKIEKGEKRLDSGDISEVEQGGMVFEGETGDENARESDFRLWSYSDIIAQDCEYRTDSEER